MSAQDKDQPTQNALDTPAMPPAASSTLAVGSLVAERYQIEAVLGRGGMGVVYRAQDRQTGQAVAIKTIFAPSGMDESQRRFQREFRALTRLHHSHIIQVFDYGEVDGLPFYVMEFIAGGDLAGLRQACGGRLSIPLLIALGRQLCDALAYIHAQGIIHRDLKPSNIMLQGDAPQPASGRLSLGGLTLKLVDFGLAKLSDVSAGLTQSGMMLGTVSYMSPEQAQALPSDARSDLYSLGVILYELATGQLPFRAETPIAVILQHISEDPPSPRRLDAAIPSELEALLLSLLAKRPAQRPASAEVVSKALLMLTSVAAPATLQIPSPAPAVRADVVFQAGLIGRETELDRLGKTLDHAWAGEGRLTVIEGEAGVGKTRLAAELGGQVRLQGGLRLAGACHETERMPYGPVAEWFNALFRLSDDFGSIVAGLEPELARLVPRLMPLERATPVENLEPGQAKLRLFDAVLRALGRLSARKPLMLLLDDLQWADEATLELLHYLVRNARGPRPASAQAAYDQQAQPSPEPAGADPLALREALANYFNEGELRDVCFDLRVDYSALPGDGKRDKARELVAYLERRKRTPELAALCRRLRPELELAGRPPADHHAPEAPAEQATVGLYRICIVATLRSEECDEHSPSAVLMRDLSRLRLLERIKLERLSPVSTADLIAAILGLGQAPPELVERIYNESEGNPFFVEEILKALVEEGLLTRQVGGWRLQADLGMTVLHIPSTLVDVVERRLARLADIERDVLNWAAVLGHEFVYDVLQAASTLDENVLLDALDSLLRGQLLVEVRDPRQDRYRFSHGKIREIAYAGLSSPRRKRMHRSAGLAIERRYAAHLEEFAPLLARHFGLGGDALKAVAYSVQAGDRARAVYANQEAIAFYQQALEWAGPTAADEPAKFVTHLVRARQGLGEVYHLVGQYEAAADSLRAVLDLAPQAGWDGSERNRMLAQAWWGLGQANEAQANYDEALRCYEQGLVGPAASEQEQRARLLSEIGWIYIRKGDYERARQQCQAAIDLGRAWPSVVATAFDYLGNAARMQGDYDRAIIYHRESLALWEEASDKSQVAKELNWLATSAEAKGAYDEAITYLQQSLTLCREIGHSLGTAFLLGNLGVIYQDQGQLDLAHDYFQQGLDIFQRIGSKDGVAISYNNLADVCIAQGDKAQAMTYLYQAELMAEEIGDKAGQVDVWLLMGEVALAEGRLDEARERSLQALGVASDSGMQHYVAKSHCLLGQVASLAGSVDEASRHLVQACALFELTGMQAELEQVRALLQQIKQ